MSITVNKYPENTVNPITMPTEFSVSSNNTAQPNFKYVCDVYAAGATRPERLRQSPHPTNGYAVFNVSGVLKSWVLSDPPNGVTAGFYHAYQSYNNFTVKFGEEYGASSAVTVYPNLTTVTGYSVFNGTFDFDEWADSLVTTTDYTLQSISRKFLTNIPNNTKLTTSEVFWLYFMNGTLTASTAYDVEFKSYNSAGTLLQTMILGNDYTTADKICSIAVGPANLNQVTGSETRFSITTALPFIDSNVSYYTVRLKNSTGTGISATRTFNIVDDCNTGTTYQLVFQNKMGGYDSFSFRAPSEKSFQVTTKDTFKKRVGEWINNEFQYYGYQRGKTQYNTVYNDKIKIKSDWITEDESTWLLELLTSPDVYYVTSGYKFIPVNITEVNYDTKEYATHQLFNLELTIEPTFNRYRQQF